MMFWTAPQPSCHSFPEDCYGLLVGSDDMEFAHVSFHGAKVLGGVADNLEGVVFLMVHVITNMEPQQKGDPQIATGYHLKSITQLMEEEYEWERTKTQSMRAAPATNVSPVFEDPVMSKLTYMMMEGGNKNWPALS
ncbi:28S ribosomal protein S7, mitochondrial [Galemys pyrenaicus]|uniref:28S ribosomal protein S7, mitochondrial n=1 Tax=Galemys pyrenaicus TaxID=202257 RepID=A0A8J5ZAQ6_GALPY|nr:28S ribosomal protein S7, mitochondrial [Galemys pyrenaicus]